jgi:hypothetical protein
MLQELTFRVRLCEIICSQNSQFLCKVSVYYKIFVTSVLGLGGVVFDSLGGGVITPPPRKKHCLK